MDLLQSQSLRLPPVRFPVPQQRTNRHLKTVLLAEDDEDLRFVMDCALTVMGYLVIACPDAQVAASAFRSRSAVDILLTDFQMPGRTGLELAREFAGLCPFLPVMLITGSILSPETLMEIQDNHWTYIAKPCRLPALAATLEQILGAERTPAMEAEHLAA